jgi:hypothetical protein
LYLNWTRLYDGRIVAESSVFYQNGTLFELANGYGIRNRLDFDQKLSSIINIFAFYEEEKAELDQIPSSWTTLANGTVITDKGYKWYPSGVVTTPKDEVFPTRATNYPNLTKILSEKDGFVNVKLSQKDLPSNFYFRSDGALVAPNGLIAYPNGWVATPDGFIAFRKKMTFIDFVNLNLQTTTIKLDS